MHDGHGYQSQNQSQFSTQARNRRLEQFEEEIDSGIRDDEPLHSPGERRQTQREGSSAIHKSRSQFSVASCQWGWQPVPQVSKLLGHSNRLAIYRSGTGVTARLRWL